MPGKPFVLNNTGHAEWYTPPHIIERARKTMGSIDLDPASCEEADRVVGAGRYYDVEANGLVQPWFGNVFINPPYRSGIISRFAEKLILERKAGHVEQAVWLSNNCTEVKWFHKLMRSEDTALCFIKGRVKFMQDGEAKGAPMQGQVLIYIGDRKVEFANNFQDVGFCCQSLRPTVEPASRTGFDSLLPLAV